MDFWGVQVPPNKPVSYRPSDNQFIHVSHAALGEGKWGNDGIIVRVKSSGKDIVLGTLAQNRCDQMKLDLIFMQEFELSHNGKGTVHLAGFTTQTGYHFYDSEDSFSEEEEDITEPTPALVKAANKAAKSAAKPGVVDAKENKEKTPAKQNGKPADKAAPKATPAVKPSTPKSEDDEDESDDDSMDMDDEDESDESDDRSDEDISDEDDSDDDDDDEDESDSEDEPQKVEDKSDKKRAAEKNLATPPTGKKIKTGTPASGKQAKETSAEKQTTPATGKKGEGKQTPAAKSVQPKTLSTDKKGKKDAPGSDGKGSAVKSSQYHCQECSRNFANDAALRMHNQAKHK